MSEIIARYLGRSAIAVLFLLWVLPVQTAQAGWSYSGLWEVDEDNAGDLLQTYQQTLTAAAGQDITPIFSLEEFVRYGFYWKEQDTSRETVSPGLTAILNNSLFALDLSASALRTLSDEPSRLHDNDLLELNLVSQWKRAWWPNLSATVGQNSTYDTLIPKVSDRSESSLNGQLDWNLRRAFLYYNYRWSKFTDNTVNRDDVLGSHMASLKASEAFWGNRLRVSFSQEYTQDSYEHEISGGGGINIIPALISRARVGTDNTPVVAPFIADIDVPVITNDPAVPIPPATIAYNVIPPATFNNIWITVNSQPVDRIYIYTQTDLFPFLPVATNWALYSSNLPGVWNPAPITLTVSYNQLQQRYELLLPGPIVAVDLKVVFDNTSLTTMDITEIDALVSAVTGAGGLLLPDTELTTSRTRLNLDAILSKTVKFKYGLSLHNEEDNQTYQRDSMTNNASLEYLASDRTLRTIFTVSDNRSDVQGQGEVASTSYGFEAGKDFLPTLHGSLNASRTEYLALGVDTLETDRYGLYLGAQLYPDLEASLEFEYSLSTNLLNGTETETSQVDWDLTSRLKPNMSLSWTETFLTTETAISSEDTLTSVLHLSWQPSDFLALSGAGRFDALKNNPDKWRVNGNIVVGIGLGMLLDIEYRHLYDQYYTQVGRGSLRWTISKYMYIRTGVDYVRKENQPVTLPDNYFKFFSDLHINFGVN